MTRGSAAGSTCAFALLTLTVGCTPAPTVTLDLAKVSLQVSDVIPTECDQAACTSLRATFRVFNGTSVPICFAGNYEEQGLLDNSWIRPRTGRGLPPVANLGLAPLPDPRGSDLQFVDGARKMAVHIVEPARTKEFTVYQSQAWEIPKDALAYEGRFYVFPCLDADFQRAGFRRIDFSAPLPFAN